MGWNSFGIISLCRNDEFIGSCRKNHISRGFIKGYQATLCSGWHSPCKNEVGLEEYRKYMEIPLLDLSRPGIAMIPSKMLVPRNPAFQPPLSLLRHKNIPKVTPVVMPLPGSSGQVTCRHEQPRWLRWKYKWHLACNQIHPSCVGNP